MIEIICDQYGLYDAEGPDILVTEPTQYEGTLSILKNHAESGDSLRIIVRNPALFDWFDAASKYGSKKRIIDPAAELANSLKQTIVPEYLQEHPHWIIELGLLEKSQEQPPQQESVVSWLKRVLLGEVWSDDAPVSADALTPLFTFLLSRNEFSLHPLEKYLLDEQFQHWSLNSPGQSELFSWLQNKPFKRAQCIVWEQLLSLFPEDKISGWLQQDNIWYELSQFPNRHRLPRLILSAQLPESIAAFARSYLIDEWNSSPEKALSFISGSLDFEKTFLMERLRQLLHDEVAISQTIYEKLIKFHKFPEVIALARQLVPTKEPSVLATDCSINEIQNWVANEYLPFYNSCSLLGKVELTEPYLREFEEYLGQRYAGMLFNGEGMAYRQITQLKQQVLAKESVLMVVFDGLDYVCAQDELLPVMHKNGFFPLNEVMPFFAFLPTQTYIAKPTLVTGKMKSQIPDEIPKASFYKELLQGYLDIPENAIRSKTNRDGTLLELIQEPAQVYLYLDNHLDLELLHCNYRQYIRKKKYSEYVRKQAEEIAQCLIDFKEMYGKSLKVLICSDHGYTVIPKAAAVIDVIASKEVKPRTLIGSDGENIGNLDKEMIWKLNPDLYGLNYEMIIPRGYSCFNKRPQGATHGGCSPQEMAVPWFILSEEKPAPPKALNFLFEGEIFRKRADNKLTLKISNPNSYSILIVEMRIKGLETAASLPLSIGKKDIVELDYAFDASIISESYVEFPVRYRLKSLAGEMEKELTIKVPTTGAMSKEFDDDFEF